MRLPSLAFVVMCACASASEAQVNGAQLRGRVMDPLGSLIGSARVEALQVATRIAWDATTGPDGEYAFGALPAGVYTVTVRAAGFKTVIAQHVVLDAGRVLLLDASMALGAIAEVVRVDAPFDTWSTSPGVRMSLSASDPSTLPANGRNYLSLLLLAPGAVTANPQSFTTGQRMTSGGRPSVNGSRRETASFLLDGIDINQHTDNLVSYLPSPDAIEEITLTTSATSAEWGNYLGGLVSTRLKSGTDTWHGSLFGFLRDQRLNATNWAANWRPPDPLNPGKKAPLDHHTVGGTVGGPLVPRRVFLFGDYQRVRRHTGPSNGIVTFVPEEMRRGDFSQLLALAIPQQLYDPLTARPDPHHPGHVLRDPFPGNQISRDRINPVAAALFAHPLYPTPDLPGASDNTRVRTTSSLDVDQGDVKIDARLSTSNLVTGRYSQSGQRVATESTLAVLPGAATGSPFASAGVTWLWQPTPGWSIESVAGMTSVRLRFSSDADGQTLGPLGETLGIAGSNRLREGLPAIAFAGAVTAIGNSGTVQRFDARTWQAQSVATWHRGARTLKLGVLVLPYVQGVYFSGNSGQLGIIEFNGQYTRDLGDPRSLGSPVADFLLGYPSRLARGDVAKSWQHRTTLVAGFGQADWRVTSALTLNAGLRYEYRTPLAETHDRQVNYDPATGGAQFAGRDGHSRSLYERYFGNVQPRMGFAWAPTLRRERLVVRASYGVTSVQEGTGTNLRLPLNPPFFNELELINRDSTILGAPISRGFDGLREKDPLTGSVLRAIDPRFRPARAHQWHMTAERLLPGGVIASLGYVGQVGGHLPVPINANQATAPTAPRPLDDVLPQIGSLILTSSVGKQQYDALQVTARKRHSSGWGVTAAYTWGHAFSDSRGFFSESGQTAEPATFWPNPRDQGAEWGPSAFDVRHTLVGGMTFDLPWGRDQRWGAAMPAWLEVLAGGWSTAATWRAYSGFAITVLAPDQSRTGARSGRPDRVGTGEGDRQVGPDGLWFDTSAFVLPRSGTFGNAGVGIIRGPGLRVVDFVLSKQIRTGGRTRLELRVEAFNLFNTPVFDAPDRQITSATFGQVRSAQLEREVQVGVGWKW